jgi:hypothetical protein
MLPYIVKLAAQVSDLNVTVEEVLLEPLILLGGSRQYHLRVVNGH